MDRLDKVSSMAEAWQRPSGRSMRPCRRLAEGWECRQRSEASTRHPSRCSKLSKLFKKTVWIAGGIAEVAWAIQANHGGGYQYRLCPAGSNLTEECFQKHPLEFVGDKQWLQFGRGLNRSNRTEIPATRVSEGTVPAGSTWTRNPIPACGDSYLGGACDDRRFLTSPFKCSSTLFPAPAPGAFGYGGAACNFEHRDYAAHPRCNCTNQMFADHTFDFSIVDQVRVPDTPGEYVLSWRHDSEQTPQVWQNCADVRIAEKGTAEPTTPFEKYDGCEACCATTHGICANCTSCVTNRTGDCAYCWTPLPGFSPAHAPVAQCLGHESSTGGPPAWKPGDDLGLWSPGCTKCWADDACNVETGSNHDVRTIV